MARVRDRILRIVLGSDREFTVRELARLVYGVDEPSLSQIKYVSRIAKELGREGKLEYKFLGNKSIVKAKKIKGESH